MHIIKHLFLVVLCSGSLGLMGQEYQPDIKQLEHDIMTWSARNDTVNKVNILCLKALCASGLLAAGSATTIFCLADYCASNKTQSPILGLILSGSFAGLFASFVTTTVSLKVLFINLWLSMYVKYHFASIKQVKNNLVRNQLAN